jgi:hypothetical protein
MSDSDAVQCGDRWECLKAFGDIEAGEIIVVTRIIVDNTRETPLQRVRSERTGLDVPGVWNFTGKDTAYWKRVPRLVYGDRAKGPGGFSLAEAQASVAQFLAPPKAELEQRCQNSEGGQQCIKARPHIGGCEFSSIPASSVLKTEPRPTVSKCNSGCLPSAPCFVMLASSSGGYYECPGHEEVRIAEKMAKRSYMEPKPPRDNHVPEAFQRSGMGIWRVK